MKKSLLIIVLTTLLNGMEIKSFDMVLGSKHYGNSYIKKTAIDFKENNKGIVINFENGLSLGYAKNSYNENSFIIKKEIYSFYDKLFINIGANSGYRGKVEKVTTKNYIDNNGDNIEEVITHWVEKSEIDINGWLPYISIEYTYENFKLGLIPNKDNLVFVYGLSFQL